MKKVAHLSRSLNAHAPMWLRPVLYSTDAAVLVTRPPHGCNSRGRGNRRLLLYKLYNYEYEYVRILYTRINSDIALLGGGSMSGTRTVPYGREDRRGGCSMFRFHKTFYLNQYTNSFCPRIIIIE